MSLRRVIQLFTLFLFLFLLTAAITQVSTAWPVDLFLRMDPSLITLTALSARVLLPAFLPVVILLGATLIMGRFFCSHVCPMGTTLEFLGKLRLFNGRKKFPLIQLNFLKYLILGFLLGGSILGVSWVFIASPLSLITRFYGLFIYPILSFLAEGGLYILRPLAERVEWNTVSFAQIASPRFATQGFIFVFFVALVILEYFSPRFWCRTLCPSGAILSLFSIRSLIGRHVSPDCTDCGKCARVCPMKAIEAETPKATRHGECIVCLSCQKICPEKAIRFPILISESGDRIPSFLPDRRHFLLAGFTGVLTAASSLTGLESPRGKPGPGRIAPAGLLRPPASLPEEEFLSRCVRCGECMAACPTNTLQPLWFEAGFMGLFSPALTPRRGYCITDCRQCSLVCPTGAITYLTPKERLWAKTGTAVIHKEKCLAWEHKKRCLVCGEVCPFKAVEFSFEAGNPVTVPEVHEERCTGCGYCEHYCPVQNQSAIVVSPMGAIRLAKGSYLETAKGQGLNFTLRQARSLEYPPIPKGETPGRAPGFD
jgi:MauM/NapG family ferredoxin protein